MLMKRASEPGVEFVIGRCEAKRQLDAAIARIVEAQCFELNLHHLRGTEARRGRESPRSGTGRRLPPGRSTPGQRQAGTQKQQRRQIQCNDFIPMMPSLYPGLSESYSVFPLPK